MAWYSIAIIAAAVAAGLLLLHLLLLVIESRAGRRLVAPRVRSWADRQVVRMGEVAARAHHYAGAGAARVWLHWVAHRVLVLLEKWLRRLGKALRSLKRKNHSVVTSLTRSGKHGIHLERLRTHKKAIRLSARDKAALKRRARGEKDGGAL